MAFLFLILYNCDVSFSCPYFIIKFFFQEELISTLRLCIMEKSFFYSYLGKKKLARYKILNLELFVETSALFFWHLIML